MSVALRDVFGITTEPTSTHVHRWTFGKPSGQREEPFALDEEHLVAAIEEVGRRERRYGAR